MRLIDADDLIELLTKVYPKETLEGVTFPTGFKQILTDIKNEPTVDPVRHGYWMTDSLGKIVCCSVCGIQAHWTFKGDYQIHSKYCPGCGARMDGAE